MNYGITVCVNHAPVAPSIAVSSHQSGRRGPNINHPLFGVGRTTYVTELVLYAARIIWSRPHHIFNTIHGASKKFGIQ